MVHRDPRQLVKEAKQIARDHGLRLVECQTPAGTDYIIYRPLPDGRTTRIGKRSTPDGIRRFVADVAGFR